MGGVELVEILKADDLDCAEVLLEINPEGPDLGPSKLHRIRVSCFILDGLVSTIVCCPLQYSARSMDTNHTATISCELLPHHIAVYRSTIR